MIMLTLLLVPPEMKQLIIPPPCLAQSPLRTGRGGCAARQGARLLLASAVFLQYVSFNDAVWHLHFANAPIICYPPCLAQTPRALASAVQPSILQTSVLPSPCLQHFSFAVDVAAVVQSVTEQNLKAPCFAQSPRTNLKQCGCSLRQSRPPCQ